MNDSDATVTPLYSSIPDTAGNEYFTVYEVVDDQVNAPAAVPHQINAMYESAGL